MPLRLIAEVASRHLNREACVADKRRISAWIQRCAPAAASSRIPAFTRDSPRNVSRDVGRAPTGILDFSFPSDRCSLSVVSAKREHLFEVRVFLRDELHHPFLYYHLLITVFHLKKKEFRVRTRLSSHY